MPAHTPADRNLVRIGKERVESVSATDFPGHHPGESHHWDLDHFRSNLRVQVNSLSPTALEFDLVGVDASVANAIRRIVIAEVPTVAVENVYVWNNTSIIQDEVLAQRLGLIPLAIDPRKLDMKKTPDEPPTDLNTVVFSLIARCERRKDVKKGETDPHKIWSGVEVLSSNLSFSSRGGQDELFGDRPPKPAIDDILVAKMRGGQEIVAELHCVKGIGKDHAKWSPVATASYRLLPTIDILADIPPELHSKFEACFPPGVIEQRSGRLVVANARRDTVSREVLRHPEFEDKVKLGRVRDHFIFSVESAGQYRPEELVPEAIEVLLAKIRARLIMLPRLKLLCAIVSVTCICASARVLVASDGAPSHGRFLESLRGAGYEVDTGTTQTAAAKLRDEGGRFDHLIVFAPPHKQTPPELSPQALARRLDAGTNLLLITSPESAEIWRDFAREFGVDFDDRGSFAVDHFSYATEDDDGTHTLLAIPPASAPSPFVSTATRAGPPIVYRGAAHSTSRNPLLTAVLHASSTTFGATLDGVVSSDDDKLVGSATSLVSSFQARNNARVSFVGSFDLFSDRFFAEGASSRFGNAAFARDLVDWTFHKTGLLVKRSSQVVVPGDRTSRPSYQVGTQLVYSLEVASSEPYQANDLQLEFGMLDPHIRTRLLATEVDQSSNVTRYSTQFKVPDRHGVFTLRVDHRRPGWTRILDEVVMSVTPPRHDEYERFIGGALPFYTGAASVSAAFLIFIVLWSQQA
ncbi:oligosaccharyl transferase glycoprotein complex, beta subunit [Rhodotorula toruloides]